MKIPAVAVKIWLIFSLTLFIFSLAQSFLLVLNFTDYTEKQLLNDVAAASGMVIWSQSTGMKKEAERQLEEKYFPLSLIDEILIQVEDQVEIEKTYEWKSEYEEIFYSIKKIVSHDETIYSLTYMWSDLIVINDLILDGLKTSFILLILMLFPSYLVSRNLVKPLLVLQNHAISIAARDLSVPIVINRKDEIGNLGKSLELMRTQLMEQEKSQQRLFQAVSHELKTPIMVIRSYIQAVEDGVGLLDQNLKVIDNEALLLEEKVAKLISLAKIGYLTSHEKNNSKQRLDLLIKKNINRLKQRRIDLRWLTDMDNVEFSGNQDILSVLFENIFDNQIRYSKKEIRISLKRMSGKIVIEIDNDGTRVPAKNLEKIFEIFFKGKDGLSGLGLSIVKEICLHYGGDICARNKFDRTSFIIELPFSHNFT